MIALYTASTPNGDKASCTLEELGLPYEVHAVDLSSGQQRSEAYLAINPNGRIPADDGTGQRVLPLFSGKIQPAIDRYQNECRRLFAVLDRRLGESEWLGDEEAAKQFAQTAGKIVQR